MNFNKRRITACVLGAAVAISPMILPTNFKGSYPSVSVAHAASKVAMNDIPAEFKESMDWIWENRILDEKSTERHNLIFDQIIAGKGTLNYIVRWQSDQKLTYENRQKMEKMISRQINAWTKWLAGFENWPYDTVDVNIVGWAVTDESIIVDKQDDEVVYTSYMKDELHNSNAAIPELLPYAPTENSRADHFWETNYQYPGTRFDMYLWGTTSMQGGAGGDWGQRVSDDYILSVLDSEDAHIIEHEIGHGFGMTDFYEEYQCPKWPEGSSNVMVAGWAQEVTEYDGWMLRYIWDKIKDESGRFDITEKEETTEEDTTITQPDDSEDDTTIVQPDDTENTGNLDFPVAGAEKATVTVSGEPYAGAAGTYSCLDAAGNVISTNDWIMSKSLGETGSDTFEIAIPKNCTTVAFDVNYYAVWDDAIGDNKDLAVNDLKIQMSLSQPVTEMPDEETETAYIPVEDYNGTIHVSNYTHKKVVGVTFDLSKTCTGSGAVHLKTAAGNWIGSAGYEFNHDNSVTIDLSGYDNIGNMNINMWWNSANASIKNVRLIVE